MERVAVKNSRSLNREIGPYRYADDPQFHEAARDSLAAVLLMFYTMVGYYAELGETPNWSDRDKSL
jgi:hypothetical protein